MNKLNRPKYDPANLTLDEYKHSEWYKKIRWWKRTRRFTTTRRWWKKYYSVISTLLSKGDKRDGKGLKILTPKNYGPDLEIVQTKQEK